MKKSLILFLAAVMLLTVFASCAGGGKEKTTTDTVAQTTSEEPVELPDTKYSGYTFRVLCRPTGGSDFTNWVSDLFDEYDSSTKTSAAVAKRNAWVCDTFDIGMKYDLTSNSNMETDAMDSLYASDDNWDLIMAHGRSIMTYSNEGYLLDWEKDLPWCDLDKPWWDQGARDTFSINNRLYVMNGNLSWMSTGYTFAMFFNKELMDDLSMEYPYALVTDGNWTFDKFSEMVRQGSKDLDGDGIINVGQDRFGYASHEHGGSFQVMYSSGSRLLLKDEDDLPFSPGVTELVERAYEEYYTLIDSDYATMYFNTDGDKAVDKEQQQALFWDGYMGEMSNFSNFNYDFGVLPWPNIDENIDGYSCHVSCYVHEFGVPFTVSDTERTSAILEALCYGGHTMVYDEYFEQTLTIQKSRDEESKKMLAIIRDSRAYDLGFFHVELDPLPNMGNLIAKIPGHSLNTFYNKYQDSINQKVDDLIDDYID